jgi:hypothetical protein
VQRERLDHAPDVIRRVDTGRLLSKPFDCDALLRHVRDALDG